MALLLAIESSCDETAVAVVRGEAVACELSGGRRLSRRAQRLALSGVDA